mgnify:CR=1 FL=1
MFDKFYELLYLKALINIVISQSKTTVYVEMLSSKGTVSSDEKSFETTHLSAEMYEFITNYTKETPYYYISVLDNSTSQGAIPTCEKHSLPLYEDLSASEYKCHDKKWIFDTAKNDLYELEHTYEKIGIDFVFSPFLVITNFFKDKIDTHHAMFLIIEESSISLSVFKNSQLLYAEYIDTSVKIETDELILEDPDMEDLDLEIDDLEEDSIDLDDIDSIDELDDFSDIADLDSIDDLDEFDETKDIEEELAVSEESEEFPVQESDSLNADYERFVAIQNSVNAFYKDEKFESEFIENVYIADAVGVSRDIQKYLEEEMAVNVYIRHLDLPAEVSELAKMELG